MKIRAFITHKKAEHFQDCQDRFSVNRDTKSVAVSDGMSQSIFQKIWAEILVDAYTKSREWTPSNESDHSTVKTILSSTWKNRVKERLNEMQKEGRNTTRTENSLALGGSAGATIVGVRFEGNKWYGDGYVISKTYRELCNRIDPRRGYIRDHKEEDIVTDLKRNEHTNILFILYSRL